jgi:hypothetical protein
LLEERALLQVVELPEAEIVLVRDSHFKRSASQADKSRCTPVPSRADVSFDQLDGLGMYPRSWTVGLLARANLLLKAAKLTA